MTSWNADAGTTDDQQPIGEGRRDRGDLHRPVVLMVAGILLGGAGLFGFGWLGGASGLEYRLLMLSQVLGATLLLIGAIGKGVQIGLASDRARR